MEFRHSNSLCSFLPFISQKPEGSIVVGLFRMSGTSVSDLYLLVHHSMLSICCTCVDPVDVVDAAAYGVLLDDSDTHVDVVAFEVEGVERLSFC